MSFTQFSEEKSNFRQLSPKNQKLIMHLKSRKIYDKIDSNDFTVIYRGCSAEKKNKKTNLA